MKKLLLIAIVLFGLQGYAQKTFEVYNFTSMTVQIGDIATDASGTYPEFHSKGTFITIPAGGSYTLVNTASTTRFPFDSPTSTPYIGTWQRFVSPTVGGPVSSIVAWTMGSPQVFKYMGFNVGGSGNTITPANTPVTGPGYTAEYSVYVAPFPATDIIYTIVIY